MKSKDKSPVSVSQRKTQAANEDIAQRISELAEATEYYEARLRGLGRDFLLEVERRALVLLELPDLGEMLDPIHRRLPLRRFPYFLIFRRWRHHSRRRSGTSQAQTRLLESSSSGSNEGAAADRVFVRLRR